MSALPLIIKNKKIKERKFTVKKIIISILLVLTLCLNVVALSSCGGNSSSAADFEIPEEGFDTETPVTITFYHTMGASLRAVLDTYIEKFNELYPNITVQHEQAGSYDDVRDKIKTEITVGNQPNIAYCYPDHVALYNLAKAPVTLDNLIADEELGLTEEQIADFIEGYYNEGKEYGDGKMYSLPFQKSTEVLYYNKTIFTELGLEAPKTWDDVENAIKVIKEKYPLSTPLGYDSEENFFITLAAQYGNDYTSSNADEHYTFVNDGNKAFVNKFAEWHQKGWMSTSALMGGSYTSDGFKKANDETGKIFMSIGSSAGARYQRPDKVDGKYPFEVGIVPVPQVSMDNPKVISQGPSICIFDDTNVQEVYASWLFVKFITTDAKFQAQYSMKSGYVPVIKSVGETATYKNYLEKADGGDFITSLVAKVALEQESYYFTSPAFAGSADARTQVGLLVQSVFTKYQLGADNTKMINDEFQKYYENCQD